MDRRGQDLDPGERQEKDLRRDLSRLAQADRFTALDKEFTALSSKHGMSLDILSHSARFPREAIVQRLVQPEEMCLPERAAPGKRQWADDCGDSLHQEGKINARVDALRRICARNERDVPDENLAWFMPFTLIPEVLETLDARPLPDEADWCILQPGRANPAAQALVGVREQRMGDLPHFGRAALSR